MSTLTVEAKNYGSSSLGSFHRQGSSPSLELPLPQLHLVPLGLDPSGDGPRRAESSFRGGCRDGTSVVEGGLGRRRGRSYASLDRSDGCDGGGEGVDRESGGASAPFKRVTCEKGK